jgi:hypothetical protein
MAWNDAGPIAGMAALMGAERSGGEASIDAG